MNEDFHFFQRVKLFFRQKLSFAFFTLFVKKALDKAGDLPRGPLIVLAPHPDDETLGCGGVIARYRQQGDTVRLFILSNGSGARVPNSFPYTSVVSLRRHEALQAAKALNVSADCVVFLDYPDGSLGQHIVKIEQDLLSQFWLEPPALILAPFSLDRHDDHIAIGQLVEAMVRSGKITCPVWYYPQWFWPDLAFKYLTKGNPRDSLAKIDTRPYLKKKQAALDAYHSQFKDQPTAYHRTLFCEIFYRIALQPFELFFTRPHGP